MKQTDSPFRKSRMFDHVNVPDSGCKKRHSMSQSLPEQCHNFLPKYPFNPLYFHSVYVPNRRSSRPRGICALTSLSIGECTVLVKDNKYLVPLFVITASVLGPDWSPPAFPSVGQRMLEPHQSSLAKVSRLENTTPASTPSRILTAVRCSWYLVLQACVLSFGLRRGKAQVQASKRTAFDRPGP